MYKFQFEQMSKLKYNATIYIASFNVRTSFMIRIQKLFSQYFRLCYKPKVLLRFFLAFKTLTIVDVESEDCCATWRCLRFVSPSILAVSM